jgi:hypothetical protein
MLLSKPCIPFKTGTMMVVRVSGGRSSCLTRSLLTAALKMYGNDIVHVLGS